jgi:hypothetical protein
MDEHAVVALMKSSESEEEWNANADTVKAAFGGDYPEFWYKAIVLSGVLATTAMWFQGRPRRRR